MNHNYLDLKNPRVDTIEVVIFATSIGSHHSAFIARLVTNKWTINHNTSHCTSATSALSISPGGWRGVGGRRLLLNGSAGAGDAPSNEEIGISGRGKRLRL